MTVGVPSLRLRRYLPFAVSGLQATLQYRASFFVSLATTATSTAVVVFLWRAVYAASPDTGPGGFGIEGITTYLIAAQVLGVLHANQVDSEIGQDILRGDIAVALIRPVSYPVMRIFTALPVLITNLLMVGLPTLLIFAVLFPLQSPAPVDLLLFLAAVPSSVVIAFSLNMLVGLCGIVTTNIWGIRIVKESVVVFFAGQLVPLDLMPAPLAAAASVLPFQSMVYAPVRLLTGRYDGASDAAVVLAGQVAWAVLLASACAVLWRVFVRRVQVLGG
ncbi:ABC transporter permease [Verrucosispora sp. NA02020]|uniref:ABC transporter permease n=1 Tax=Verrucosispora sp. NA02020 TaxID=2742132 RepID=UPI003D71A580